MKLGFTDLVKGCMNLELMVSELYTVFYKNFPEDADFWWRLVLEEKNHAALFRSGVESDEIYLKFPEDLVLQEIATLDKENQILEKMIDDFNLLPPTREEAFNIALSLENEAVEIHFQQFMEGDNKSSIDKIFQELNKADIDHAKRIFSYMQEHGIAVTSENQEKMRQLEQT